MSDTTFADIQATLDYAATLESNDLTEIAGGEHEVLTEQADDATKAAVAIATAFPTPIGGTLTLAGATPASTAIAFQLPNTGSGGGSSAGITVLIVLVLCLALTVALIRRRGRVY